MGYYYSGCNTGCAPIRRSKRRNIRTVYGCAMPCFSMKIGEIKDVTIDVSDEASCDSEVATAAPVPSFISALDGSTASAGSLTVTGQPPENGHQVDIIVNAQDANLTAGEIWQVVVQIQMDDGRVIVRGFKLKLQASTGACFAPVTCPTTTDTTTCGTVISGSAQTISPDCSPGIFTLTPPAGAGFAQFQFLTPGVYTVDGSTPSDTNGVGFQMAAGAVVDLSATEIAVFRVTGANDGADGFKGSAVYYTSDPNNC